MMRPLSISKRSFAIIFGCLLALFSVMLLFARLRHRAAPASRAENSHARMAGLPKLFLWAWERPEQLEFIDTREVGVAFLSKTIYLRGERVQERPRMQPLKVPKGTTLMAVVRIESVRGERPALTTSQRDETVAALLEAARAPEVRALQIDFDAAESERGFYRGLLEELRARLPQTMPLSITALASWCIHDDWVKDLPIDEAVPMLFRMGLDDERIKSYLKEGGEFRSSVCRLSTGVSTDEPLDTAHTAPRLYVFHPQSWTPVSVRSVIERNQR